jgi:hypothetical protein
MYLSLGAGSTAHLGRTIVAVPWAYQPVRRFVSLPGSKPGLPANDISVIWSF